MLKYSLTEKAIVDMFTIRQAFFANMSLFRRQNQFAENVRKYPQTALSLTCGYENYVPSELRIRR
jgi:hypothetical protein